MSLLAFLIYINFQTVIYIGKYILFQGCLHFYWKKIKYWFRKWLLQCDCIRVSTLRFAVYRNLAWFQHLKRVHFSHKWQQVNKRVPFKQLHLSIFLSFSSLGSIHHDHQGWEISTEKQTLKRSIIIRQSLNTRLSSAIFQVEVQEKNVFKDLEASMTKEKKSA